MSKTRGTAKTLLISTTYCIVYVNRTFSKCTRIANAFVYSFEYFLFDNYLVGNHFMRRHLSDTDGSHSKSFMKIFVNSSQSRDIKR